MDFVLFLVYYFASKTAIFGLFSSPKQRPKATVCRLQTLSLLLGNSNFPACKPPPRSIFSNLQLVSPPLFLQIVLQRSVKIQPNLFTRFLYRFSVLTSLETQAFCRLQITKIKLPKKIICWKTLDPSSDFYLKCCVIVNSTLRNFSLRNFSQWI